MEEHSGPNTSLQFKGANRRPRASRPRKEEEKLQHNAYERRRKQRFNSKLKELHDLLPHKPRRYSKLRIVEAAIEHLVHTLREKEHLQGYIMFLELKLGERKQQNPSPDRSDAIAPTQHIHLLHHDTSQTLGFDNLTASPQQSRGCVTGKESYAVEGGGVAQPGHPSFPWTNRALPQPQRPQPSDRVSGERSDHSNMPLLPSLQQVLSELPPEVELPSSLFKEGRAQEKTKQAPQSVQQRSAWTQQQRDNVWMETPSSSKSSLSSSDNNNDYNEQVQPQRKPSSNNGFVTFSIPQFIFAGAPPQPQLPTTTSPTTVIAAQPMHAFYPWCHPVV